MGRNFSPDDDRRGAADVVLLTDSLWHRRYNRDPAIVGKTIAIDGQPATVIGILPPGFRFLAVQPTMGAIELWTPLHMPSARGDPSGALECIARLKHGVARDQAAAQITALTRQLAGDCLRRSRSTALSPSCPCNSVSQKTCVRHCCSFRRLWVLFF